MTDSNFDQRAQFIAGHQFNADSINLNVNEGARPRTEDQARFVLDGWSRIVEMVPPDHRAPQRLPEYLASVTRIPLVRITEARNVRNRLAHDGTYTEAKIARAAKTIIELGNALTAPPPAAHQQQAASAKLVFYRPYRWSDSIRSYALHVDGDHRGNIRVNQELTVDISPGLHTVEARIGRSSSPLLEFEVQPGQAVRINVKPTDPITAASGLLRLDREKRIEVSID